MTVLIMRYVSVWGWHLIAIMFFLQGIGFLEKNNYLWMLGMFGVAVFCEIMSFLRKRKLYEEEDGT